MLRCYSATYLDHYSIAPRARQYGLVSITAKCRMLGSPGSCVCPNAIARGSIPLPGQRREWHPAHSFYAPGHSCSRMWFSSEQLALVRANIAGLDFYGKISKSPCVSRQLQPKSKRLVNERTHATRINNDCRRDWRRAISSLKMRFSQALLGTNPVQAVLDPEKQGAGNGRSFI